MNTLTKLMRSNYSSKIRNSFFYGLLALNSFIPSSNALEKKLEIDSKSNHSLEEIDYRKDGVIDPLDLFVSQGSWHASTDVSINYPNRILELKENWHETYDARILPESFTVDIPQYPFTDNSRDIVMLKINKGGFLMGSPEDQRGRSFFESPQHEVNINYNFYMQETEVTQAQWSNVMDSYPGYTPSIELGRGNDYPIYHVSWDQANDFANKLNEIYNDKIGGKFRLPSEAEWEYVCRAGTTTRFFFGDSLNCNDECDDCETGNIEEGALPGNRSDYVWYCANNQNVFHEVGKMKPNAWGVYDMPGNVVEWCEDYFHFDYRDAPSDGSADLRSPPFNDLRIMRGSSIDEGSRFINVSRSAARGATNGTFEFNGLRLVYDSRLNQ